MLTKNDVLFLLVTSSLIIQTFSSVMWHLEEGDMVVELSRKSRKLKSK